jgi:endoglycosylceramidase
MWDPTNKVRALALCAAVAGCAIPASAHGSAPAGKLGHAGRWLTDSKGRVVITHGENIVSKFAPWAPSAVGFGEDDVKFLVKNGFNTARVGVEWAGVEPEPGVYDDAMLARVREVVGMLYKRHIGVILDSHQDMYNPRYQGNGFPDWALNDEDLPNPQLGFPDNYFGNPALWRSFENFWANKPAPGDTMGVQDRFAAMWHHVAGFFADVPGVFGYEVMNEPFPGSEWTTCANPEGCPLFDNELSAFYGKVDQAIRSVDEHTLVWYEPNVSFNFGVNTHVTSPGPGSGFAFHDYCLTNEAEGCPTHETTITNAEKYVAGSGDALLMDEWGATNGASDLQTMVSLADQHMVPWMEWEYCWCNEGGPGTHNPQGLIYDEEKPPSGENVNGVVLEALVEPYPQVVSGTPTSWGFDRPSRTFTFRYSTRAAAGTGAFRSGSLTSISTPRFSYPTGYAVQVSGGRWVSKPGARITRVASCPGAGEVQVTVAPGIPVSQGC